MEIGKDDLGNRIFCVSDGTKKGTGVRNLCLDSV